MKVTKVIPVRIEPSTAPILEQTERRHMSIIERATRLAARLERVAPTRVARSPSLQEEVAAIEQQIRNAGS